MPHPIMFSDDDPGLAEVRRIALGLRKLRNKELENPWKKHDNIPL